MQQSLQADRMATSAQKVILHQGNAPPVHGTVLVASFRHSGGIDVV